MDLKDNPLEPGLAKAAGDCLDEKQCKQCATKVRDRETDGEKSLVKQSTVSKTQDRLFQVLQHMRAIQDDVDRAREKRLLKEKGGCLFLFELQNDFRRSR